MSHQQRDLACLPPGITRRAAIDSLRKLHPRHLLRNPVMFTVLVGSVFTLVLAGAAFAGVGHREPLVHPAHQPLALVHGHLRQFRRSTRRGSGQGAGRRPPQDADLAQGQQTGGSRQTAELYGRRSATELRKGDVVVVHGGRVHPGDGEVVEGVASVDESAVTGESAPVIRESGGDRSAVTGGTKVLSDWLVVRVTANPGESFLDRIIGLIEAAKRKKTPNEIALEILLAGLTLIFLLTVVTLLPMSIFSVAAAGRGTAISLTVLVALLVCLIPTTIGGLLSAIGIAGMDRMIRKNVIAMSGRAVEAAGDVDVLLLDKTGTITLGNRQATAFMPADDVTVEELADAAQLASLADETPEGRSIVVLAKEKFRHPRARRPRPRRACSCRSPPRPG